MTKAMVGLMKAQLELNFIQEFEADGFTRIGTFNIVDSDGYRIFINEIDFAEANDWLFAIYAYVSFANGGKPIRIGKSEQKLSVRLRTYVYHVGGAVKDRDAKNEQFKGSTPPWEREGWLEYTIPYGGGVIFAQSAVPLSSDQETKQALRSKERHLIIKYDPPL